LVYLALATAFSSARVVDSTLFMFFFGLGTLPAMWSITFLAHWFSPTNRSTLRRLVPWVYALTGLLLVMRGLGHHNPLQHYMPHQYCIK
jgi:sulfite exporter TauE/SafE